MTADEIRRKLISIIREDNEFREELKQELRSQEAGEKEENSNNSPVSRRNFLKKAGLSMAGLGAATILPAASALNIESDRGLSYFNSSDKKFEVDSEGYLNVEKISTGEISTDNLNRSQIPSGETLEDIQELVDQTGNVYIDLKPDTVYEGDTTITIDPADSNGDPRTVYIDATGAGLDYTGSEGGIIDILENYNHGYSGRVKVIGGSYSGPGNDVSGSYCIRATDIFGPVIRVENVGDAENGIFLRNENHWAENAYLGLMNGGMDEITSESPKYTIRGGGSRGGSQRDIRVDVPWGSAADGGKVVWQDDVGWQGGDIRMRCMAPPDGICYHKNGNGSGAVVRFEAEFGNSNTVGIKIDSGQPAVYLHPRFRQSGTNVINNTNRRSLALSNTGLSILSGDDDNSKGFGGSGKVLGVTHPKGGAQARRMILKPAHDGEDSWGFRPFEIRTENGDLRYDIQRGKWGVMNIRNHDDSPVAFKNSSGEYVPVSTGHVQNAENVGEVIDSGKGKTVAAEGTTTVTASNATDPTISIESKSVILGADSDPRAAFGLEASTPRWNGSEWEFDVTETEGNASVTFSWRLLGIKS